MHDAAMKKPATLVAAAAPRPKIKVAILGGTGMVGRALALHLQTHQSMELAFLVGSPDTAGKSLKQVWERKELVLQQHYGSWWKPLLFPSQLSKYKVQSFDDVLQCTEPDLCIISCLAPSLGWMEDELIAQRRVVYSISPHARNRVGVPLVVPEVNFPQLKNSPSLLFKSPNCVSCGVCLVLDALRTSFGALQTVSITTFQSLSGRGDALYSPAERVLHNVLPLGNFTEEDTNTKIRDEVCKVLNDPELRISVTAQRVCVQRGHYVDVRVCLERKPENPQDVKRALDAYAPLSHLTLEDAPLQPIATSLDKYWPRPVQCAEGMQVQVGHISTQDRVFDVCLSLVVDNVNRGAFGAALLIAQVHRLLLEKSSI